MSRTLVALMFLVSALAGCSSPPAPPSRSSAPLRVVDGPSVYETSFASRDGVTIAYDATSGQISSLDRMGAHALRSVARDGLGVCVLGAGEVAVITPELVQVGEATTPVAEVLGEGADLETLYWAGCSGTSADDVWVVMADRLAHFDGAEWTRTSLEGLVPWAGVVATDRFVYLRLEDGVYRQAREGGELELVRAAAYETSLHDVDATHAGIVVHDMYEAPYEALLIADDDSRASYDLESLTSELGGTGSFAIDVVFDGTQGLYLSLLDSEGRSETSFGGSTTRYYPDWIQVTLFQVEGATVRELGHFDEIPPEGSTGVPSARVVVTAEGPVVGYDSLLLTLP